MVPLKNREQSSAYRKEYHMLKETLYSYCRSIITHIQSFCQTTRFDSSEYRLRNNTWIAVLVECFWSSASALPPTKRWSYSQFLILHFKNGDTSLPATDNWTQSSLSFVTTGFSFFFILFWNFYHCTNCLDFCILFIFK